jgi:hypothetical protein
MSFIEDGVSKGSGNVGYIYGKYIFVINVCTLEGVDKVILRCLNYK